MHNQRILTRCLITAICWTTLFIAVTFLFFSDVHVQMPETYTKPLHSNIYAREGDQTRILSIPLPQEFDEPFSLLFKTTHTKVEITLGRTSIYSYGHEGMPSFISSPGAVWHIVDIPAGSAGLSMAIYIDAVYKDYYGNDPEIRFGSREGCAAQLLINSLPIVIINCIILFVGIVCLVLHSIGWLRRGVTAKNSFLFVGLFAFSIATWSLCQSGFLQFLIPDGLALYLIDFFSFYLFPVTFNLFLASICKERSETVFCFLAGGYLLELTLFAILQAAGVTDLFQTLRFGHILMAINAVCVFFFVHYEIYHEKNDMARKFRIPLYVVISFGIAELVSYYINGFRQTSYFLPVGTIVFIFMLTSQLITQYYHSVLEEAKMAYFKKLANTDMLTEVFNRNAYENKLRSLAQQEMQLRTTCVVLFDINNMKQINDRYGHDHGDQALKACCRCILRAFGDEGSCYRIGGDEFVYLCHNREDIQHCAARFGEIVRREAQNLDFPFRVAIGYASYDPQKDNSLSDLIRRSDEMMYRSKELQKRYDDPFALSTEKAALVED